MKCGPLYPDPVPARRSSGPPEQFLELAELLSYVAQVVARGIPGSVWVRAEVASVTDRRHLYFDLVQLEGGEEVAKTRANLWARERFAVENQFARATGGPFAAGQKLLLMVTADFHEQYGFSLTIHEVSPEYTLGDAARKLTELREALVREGLYELNRQLDAPQDYRRVAVLSPREAAGLGDFRREADRLQRGGVTDFAYFEATFQGREAPRSLLSALAAAQLEHAAEPFDALVVVRGGGAVTDLAWLNDLNLARAVCTFPAPVVTGIGHARDDTILDEVACLRTDTPSKAAQLILGTVAGAAAQAEADWRAAQGAGAGLLASEAGRLEAAHTRTGRAARSLLTAQAARLDLTMRAVLGLTPERTLARGYALVRGAGGQVVRGAAQAQAEGQLTLSFADGVVGVEVREQGDGAR